MKVQVLLPKIFNLPFTYKLEKKNDFKKGDVVEIPFGSNKEIGVIWNDLVRTPKKIKIKAVTKKIKDFSINQKLINFIDWFSMYNMVPRGLVLKMCIGNGKNIFKDKDNVVSSPELVDNKFELNEEQKISLEYLEKKSNKFVVSVLQGATGSGKTLVYFERIKK